MIKIYTDGACKGNPGPGGWGALIIYNNDKKEIYGGENETTNNRMELNFWNFKIFNSFLFYID